MHYCVKLDNDPLLYSIHRINIDSLILKKLLNWKTFIAPFKVNPRRQDARGRYLDDTGHVKNQHPHLLGYPGYRPQL